MKGLDQIFTTIFVFADFLPLFLGLVRVEGGEVGMYVVIVDFEHKNFKFTGFSCLSWRFHIYVGQQICFENIIMVIFC